MKNKTKEELLQIIEEQQEKIEQLQNDVDYWQHEHDLLYEENEKLEEQLENQEECESIKNLDNFIWKLKLDNLYTNELEQFLEDYMKFNNN